MPNVQQILFTTSKKPFSQINPKNLGWIRPDGIINFATKDAAKTYAINRCIAANKVQNKFERGVVIKDNMILSEADGNFANVYINHKELSKKYADCELYHNHTTPGTFSSADFGVLKTRKYLKSMIAIDLHGYCYTMTKMPLERIKFLPRILSDLITISMQTIKGIIKFESIKSEYIDEIRSMDKEVLDLYKQLSIEELMIMPVYTTLMKKVIKMVSEIDKMWSENAKSLGVKYERGKI